MLKVGAKVYMRGVAEPVGEVAYIGTLANMPEPMRDEPQMDADERVKNGDEAWPDDTVYIVVKVYAIEPYMDEHFEYWYGEAEFNTYYRFNEW